MSCWRFDKNFASMEMLIKFNVYNRVLWSYFILSIIVSPRHNLEFIHMFGLIVGCKKWLFQNGNLTVLAGDAARGVKDRMHITIHAFLIDKPLRLLEAFKSCFVNIRPAAV